MWRAPDSAVLEVNVLHPEVIELPTAQEEIEAQVCGAGEVRINLVQDGQVGGVKPELAVLRWGGVLLPAGCCGAQGEAKVGKKPKLLGKLKGGQEGPSPGGTDADGVVTETTLQGMLCCGGVGWEIAGEC